MSLLLPRHLAITQPAHAFLTNKHNPHSINIILIFYIYSNFVLLLMSIWTQIMKVDQCLACLSSYVFIGSAVLISFFIGKNKKKSGSIRKEWEVSRLFLDRDLEICYHIRLGLSRFRAHLTWDKHSCKTDNFAFYVCFIQLINFHVKKINRALLFLAVYV